MDPEYIPATRSVPPRTFFLPSRGLTPAVLRHPARQTERRGNRATPELQLSAKDLDSCTPPGDRQSKLPVWLILFCFYQYDNYCRLPQSCFGVSPSFPTLIPQQHLKP